MPIITQPNAPHLHSANGAYITELIDTAGLTRRQVAGAIGITTRQLRNYENGFCPVPYPVQFTIEAFCR